jgi:hypothetical protein
MRSSFLSRAISDSFFDITIPIKHIALLLLQHNHICVYLVHIYLYLHFTYLPASFKHYKFTNKHFLGEKFFFFTTVFSPDKFFAQTQNLFQSQWNFILCLKPKNKINKKDDEDYTTKTILFLLAFCRFFFFVYSVTLHIYYAHKLASNEPQSYKYKYIWLRI